ncbi:putative holin-like toxin [Halalkalibacillus halophilus]|nr:putative holin-like toxin [Halalkalibacillus halophilus]
METYGYILVVLAFGTFIIGLLSLVIQIVVAIAKKK